MVGAVADGQEENASPSTLPVLGRVPEVARIQLGHPGVFWVMAIGDNYQRLRVMQEIQRACPEAAFPTVVHPAACVAADAGLGEGAIVMPRAILMAGCRLGCCTLVNTGALLDHECQLEEGASLAPGVVTGGRVSIGRRAFIGIGTTIIQGVTVGADSVVGAGSLILRDVPERVVAWGSPARVIRPRREDERYL